MSEAHGRRPRPRGRRSRNDADDGFPRGRPFQGCDPSNLAQFARAEAAGLPTGCRSHSRGFPTVKALREAV